ncbi:hypothetical protein [Niallia circulans]|uniref:hypothetical protein n=1 Tax=Niallia circulans TaxID=1397 RepID=UPI001560C767|nr:hypothetical protein [Niallia circulans]NRG31732.1 hypothetical protein [Niallia circulans]
MSLVVDNTKNAKEISYTCRNSCDLYDVLTESCSIKNKVDVDNPLVVTKCSRYLPTSSLEIDIKINQKELDGLEEEEISYPEIQGQIETLEKSCYPFKPDFPAGRTDANWYVSPCQEYGCWIVNDYKKPIVLVSPNPGEKVYKSAVPLHNHNASIGLASRIAWYIDENGIGRYVTLLNGHILN